MRFKSIFILLIIVIIFCSVIFAKSSSDECDEGEGYCQHTKKYHNHHKHSKNYDNDEDDETEEYFDNNNELLDYLEENPLFIRRFVRRTFNKAKDIAKRAAEKAKRAAKKAAEKAKKAAEEAHKKAKYVFNKIIGNDDNDIDEDDYEKYRLCRPNIYKVDYPSSYYVNHEQKTHNVDHEGIGFVRTGSVYGWMCQHFYKDYIKQRDFCNIYHPFYQYSKVDKLSKKYKILKNSQKLKKYLRYFNVMKKRDSLKKITWYTSLEKKVMKRFSKALINDKFQFTGNCNIGNFRYEYWKVCDYMLTQRQIIDVRNLPSGMKKEYHFDVSCGPYKFKPIEIVFNGDIYIPTLRSIIGSRYDPNNRVHLRYFPLNVPLIGGFIQTDICIIGTNDLLTYSEHIFNQKKSHFNYLFSKLKSIGLDLSYSKFKRMVSENGCAKGAWGRFEIDVNMNFDVMAKYEGKQKKLGYVNLPVFGNYFNSFSNRFTPSVYTAPVVYNHIKSSFNGKTTMKGSYKIVLRLPSKVKSLFGLHDISLYEIQWNITDAQNLKGTFKLYLFSKYIKSVSK